MMAVDQDRQKDLHRDMALAMRDMLGSGFTDEYYRSLASDFVWIAVAHGACTNDE